MSHSFSKKERLQRAKDIHLVLSRGKKASFENLSIRVNRVRSTFCVQSKVLFLISARRLSYAHERNLVRRRLRHAYCLHKHLLAPVEEGMRVRGEGLHMAWIYLPYGRCVSFSVLQSEVEKGFLWINRIYSSCFIPLIGVLYSSV